MTEIQKITKVSLLAYGIVCLLYGILAIFLLDMMVPILGPMDPFQPRLFGGVLFVIGIFNFLIIKQIKIKINKNKSKNHLNYIGKYLIEYIIVF